MNLNPMLEAYIMTAIHNNSRYTCFFGSIHYLMHQINIIIIQNSIYCQVAVNVVFVTNMNYFFQIFGRKLLLIFMHIQLFDAKIY